MVLSVGRVHHPPTRKDTLKLLVHSDLPVSPWFDAGDHRSLRAPANFLNLTCGPPLSASILFSLETFSVGAFGQIRFPFELARFYWNRFLFSQLSPWNFSVSLQMSPWTETLITF